MEEHTIECTGCGEVELVNGVQCANDVQACLPGWDLDPETGYWYCPHCIERYENDNKFGIKKQSTFFLSYDDAIHLRDYLIEFLKDKTMGTNVNELRQVYDFRGVVEWLSKNAKKDTPKLIRGFLKKKAGLITRKELQDTYNKYKDEMIICPECGSPNAEPCLETHENLYHCIDCDWEWIEKKSIKNEKEHLKEDADEFNDIEDNANEIEDKVKNLRNRDKEGIKKQSDSYNEGTARVSSVGLDNYDITYDKQVKQILSQNISDEEKYDLIVNRVKVILAEDSSDFNIDEVDSIEQKIDYVQIQDIIEDYNSDKELEKEDFNNQTIESKMGKKSQLFENSWNKEAIQEILEAVGQDDIRWEGEKEGISLGDWGTVRFYPADDNSLRLDFEDNKMANQAWNAFSNALSNPYEFSTRFDIVDNQVMVTFTDNETYGKMEKKSEERNCPSCGSIIEYADDMPDGEEYYYCTKCEWKEEAPDGIRQSGKRKIKAANPLNQEEEILEIEPELDIALNFDNEQPEEQSLETGYETINPEQSKDIIESQLMNQIMEKYPNDLTYTSIFDTAQGAGLTETMDRYDVIGILNQVAVKLGLQRIGWESYWPEDDIGDLLNKELTGTDEQITYDENNPDLKEFMNQFDNEGEDLFMLDRMLDERLKHFVKPEELIDEAIRTVSKAFKNLKKKQASVIRYKLGDFNVSKSDGVGRIINGVFKFSVRLKSKLNQNNEKTIEVPIEIRSRQVIEPREFTYSNKNYPLENYYISSIMEN